MSKFFQRTIWSEFFQRSATIMVKAKRGRKSYKRNAENQFTNENTEETNENNPVNINNSCSLSALQQGLK